MNVFIAFGSEVVETTKDEFFKVAYLHAQPGRPVNVYRDPELTDLFATVWADGGIDYRR